MTTALFQHIPRCLFEPLAVLGLIGLVLFLIRHWKRDKAETALFAAAVLFMTLWRVLMPINADRYALILIPIAIYCSLTALEELRSLLRKFIPLPPCGVLFAILLVVCAVKAFRVDTGDRLMFGMIRALRNEAESAGKPTTVVSNRDVSYFLGDDYAVTVVPVEEKGALRLTELPEADYYLFKVKCKLVPICGTEPGFTLLKKVSSPDQKSVFVLWKNEVTR